MKHTFLKINSLVICIVLVLCSIAGISFSVSAETEPQIFTTELDGNTYSYTVTDGNATIVEATVKGDVVIPETLDGYDVVALGVKAFYYQKDLTSLTVPGCVKTIGDSCFEDCYNLESVVLEDGVETIGKSAFYTFVVIWGLLDCGCCTDVVEEHFSALKTLVLPDSIRSIGASAFKETLLSGTLTLPASLEYLGENAFSSTNIETLKIPASMTYNENIVFSRFANLKEIIVDPSNTNYYMDNKLLMANGGTVALYFVGNTQTDVTVPNTTKIIEKSCFEGTNLQKVTLPENLLEIRQNAFKNCSALTDIALPTTLKKVEENAFYSCSSLEKIAFNSHSLILGNFVFSGCKMLNDISFAGDELSIGDSAFFGCSNLKELVLSPEKVYLGASLFCKTGIETVVIKSNNITTHADLYTTRELYYPGYNDNMFQKLVVGKNVTTLNEALYLPLGIWSVTVEDGNTSFMVEDTVLYNADKTKLIRFFSKTDASTWRYEFTVPETVTEISAKAFFGASAYRVALPSALEIIGDQAFYKSNLYGSDPSRNTDNFVLPASVKKIGYRAFGKTLIRGFGLAGNKLEKLAPNMFHGCDTLKDVYYIGSKEQLDEILVVTEGSYLSSARFHYNTTIAEHPFVETVGKKATTKEDGYYLHTCPCGQSYTVPITKINDIQIACSYIADHFSTKVYARPAHSASHKLEYGKDYTYTLSACEYKDDCLSVKYTFFGELYEGTLEKLYPLQLDKPKSLTAKETTNGVTLSWQKVKYIDGYKIWRQAKGESKWELIATTTNLSYNDNPVKDGTTYTYKVVPFVNFQGSIEITGERYATTSLTTTKLISNNTDKKQPDKNLLSPSTGDNTPYLAFILLSALVALTLIGLSFLHFKKRVIFYK